MSTKNSALWLCLFGTLTLVVVGYRFVWNETPVSDFKIGAGMGQDLMTRNGQLDFDQVKQLIAEQTKNGEWQMSGTSSDRPFRSIVTACSADGCRTFTYDGDGNLIPYIPDSSDLTDSPDNPFGDPMP